MLKKLSQTALSLIMMIGLSSFSTGLHKDLDLFYISKDHIVKYCSLGMDDFKSYVEGQEFEFLTDDEDGCKSYWHFCMDCDYDVVFWTCPEEQTFFMIQFSAEKNDASELEALKKLISDFKASMSENLSESEWDGENHTTYYFEQDSKGYTVMVEENNECEESEFEPYSDCYDVNVQIIYEDL